jgi:drug/metabolite transporter (DMT)-like permease
MIAAALLCAVLGAACLAGAAVLQHGAMTGPTLDLAGLRALAARPRWLAGIGLAAAGAGLHAVGLVLAPVSVVQPVGVLAVPIAVGITLRGRWPGWRVAGGIGLCAAGIALVVRTAAGAVPHPPADPAQAIAVAATTAAALVLGLAVVAARTTGRVRCLACAAGGAVAFGLVSAVVRAVSLQIAAGTATAAGVLGAAAGVAVALAVGGWLVQQAMAAGRPAVVVAVLTVVDPLVAVGSGALVLGEAGGLGTGGVALLLLCGVAAAAGVALLARHHPDAVPRRADEEEVLT